jgi:CheY-like chemotaxis protein
MDHEAADPNMSPHPPYAPPRPRARRRVLVVDEKRSERDLYSAHLRGAGFDVQVAADGLEALARTVARRPDAIVMDASTPTLDASELTRRLQAAAATRGIPVIALGPRDPARARELSEVVGCAACLPRPLRPEDVRAEVERQLDRHRPRPCRRGRAGRM